MIIVIAQIAMFVCDCNKQLHDRNDKVCLVQVSFLNLLLICTQYKYITFMVPLTVQCHATEHAECIFISSTRHNLLKFYLALTLYKCSVDDAECLL